MKQLLLFVLLFASAIISFSQKPFQENDLYLEAGGNGLFGSVNYERQLTQKPGMGIRVGIGFYTENAFYLTVPIGINYLFPLKKKGAFIDAGLGATWAKINGNLFANKRNNDNSFASFIPSIGYRKHADRNVMWRISLTPIANKNGVFPWVGFSLGKRF